MASVEKMWNALEKAKKELYGHRDRYLMKYQEIITLMNQAGNNPFTAVVNAFDYGFIKGMRYQKAQEKKRRATKA